MQQPQGRSKVQVESSVGALSGTCMTWLRVTISFGLGAATESHGSVRKSQALWASTSAYGQHCQGEAAFGLAHS